MSNKVSTSRIIVVTLLSFVMSLLLALSGILAVVGLTVMDGDYAAEALEKSQFAEIELKRIKEHFISYGAAGNVEEAFFTDFFEKSMSSEKISVDMAKSVKALYSGEDISKDKYFYDELYSALTVYAEQKGMRIEDKEIIDGIKEFTGDLIELYRGYVTFPYASNITPVIQRVEKYILPAMALFLLLALVAAVVIFMSYKRKTAPVSYLGCAFGGAGLMLIVIPAVVLLTGQIEKFTLTDEAIRSFFIEFAGGFAVNLIVCGAVLVAVAAVLYFVCSSIRAKKKQSYITEAPSAKVQK